MIVKASIQWLNKDTDAQLINDCGVIINGMTDNATVYASPVPPLPTVQTALDSFSTAVVVAAMGGAAAKAARNNARLVLTGLVRQLASYVTVTANDDMATLLLSGFPVQKPVRTPIGVLPAPASTVLVLGARTGELNAGVKPVFGASVYNWQLTSSAPGSAPQTAQSTASSITFTGLTPGVIYTVSANAMGAAGPSNWSNPASQMAV